MPPKSILKKRPLSTEQVASGVTTSKGSINVKVARRDGVDTATRAIAEQRHTDADDDDDDDDDSDDADTSDFGGNTDEDSLDEEDAEIMAMQDDKDRPTKRIKHPTLKPTSATDFSQALTHLINLPQSTSTLAPRHAPPSAHTRRLEQRARTLIKQTKAQHYARGHVRDVISGWAPRPPLPFSLWESQQARDFERARTGQAGDVPEGVENSAEREKRLRKLAQRGVVRLFNAIRAAQGAPERAEWEDKLKRKAEAIEAGGDGTQGQATESSGPGGKVTRRPNVLGGRGKGETLTNLSKASFLELIRAGTTTA
ncbi:hypothetical protein OIO90_002660 [Microbotryomycetes sp. JL221]|nr:hypothetical protein OIO90_002660 [Microbotryomycetes sp. JL221]